MLNHTTWDAHLVAPAIEHSSQNIRFTLPCTVFHENVVCSPGLISRFRKSIKRVILFKSNHNLTAMFRNPFSFDGRIRRMEYGITFIIYLIFYVLQAAIMTAGSAGPLIGFVLMIPMVWFLWAQGAKRCHDVGRSGWWQLIPFYVFVLVFEDGESGTNIYGSNPKIPGSEQLPMESETLDGHLRN
jgi:uncharacterized membrane protein YhaH (DUF805 family)